MSFYFKPHYYQNDGGKLKYIKLYKTGDDNVTDFDDYDVKYTYDFTQEYELGTEMKIDLKVEDGDFFIGKLVFSYEDGGFHSDNLGKDDYHIKKGKITKPFVISGIRKSFIGKTSGGVRYAIMQDTPTKDFSINISELDNRTDIVIAFPSNTLNIKDIIYRQQMCTILDMFDVSVEMVNGANDYPAISYDVYRMTLEQVNVQEMIFDVKVGELDE